MSDYQDMMKCLWKGVADTDQQQDAADRIEELEAKLAKAVEALEFYGKLIGEKHDCPWHMLSDDFGEKARTTLAELSSVSCANTTGGKDE